MEERVNRLERENRRLKMAGLVALAVIAAVVLMGQATGGKVAKVVEAERFVLRDPLGPIRAELRTKIQGSTVLQFYGTSGKREARYEGRGLTFYDSNGNVAIHLQNLGEFTRDLVINRPNKAGGIRLASSVLGSNVTLHGNEGKQRAKLVVRDDGSPRLTLFDNDEQHRLVLGRISLETPRTGVVEERPESSLVLFDKAGKVIWSAP